MSDLYNRIQELCKANNISVTTMCKESGASRASLSDLKVGRKQSLSAETLSKIASYFGVSVDYLINGSYRSEITSLANGIVVLHGSSQQELDASANELERGSYRIVYREHGVIIAADNDGPATDEQIDAIIATYSNQKSTKKAPAGDGERSVSDDDIKFALFRGREEITDAMYEEVLNFAEYVARREEEKKRKG